MAATVSSAVSAGAPDDASCACGHAGRAPFALYWNRASPSANGDTAIFHRLRRAAASARFAADGGRLRAGVAADQPCRPRTRSNSHCARFHAGAAEPFPAVAVDRHWNLLQENSNLLDATRAFSPIHCLQLRLSCIAGRQEVSCHERGIELPLDWSFPGSGIGNARSDPLT